MGIANVSHVAVLVTNELKSLSRNTSFGDPLREGTKTTLSMDCFIQGHEPDMGLGGGGLGVPVVLGSFLRSSTSVLIGLQNPNGLASISTLFRSLLIYIARMMTEMARMMVSTSRTYTEADALHSSVP